jgi:hypothetical protein
VHECLLGDQEADELFLQLARELDPATDRLLLAWLNPRRPAHARGIGRIGNTRGGLHAVR